MSCICRIGSLGYSTIIVVVCLLGVLPWATLHAQDVPSFDYDDYASVAEILYDLATTNSDITYLFSLGATYQGRQQWVLRITAGVDHDIPNDKPAVLFTCAIHARERIPVQVGLAFANYICSHKADEDIKELIESLDIYIVPMANPDGTSYNGCCQSVNCWRKTTNLHHDRGFESTVPENGSGVDMNRTWDYEWDYVGTGKILQTFTYRGGQPLLVSEVRSLRKFMRSLPNLAAHLDWHSAGGQVFYIWNGKYDSVENSCHRNVLMSIAAGMANITGYIFQEGNRIYLSAADTGDSDEAVMGILSFTIETQWNVNGLKPVYTCELFDPPYPTDQTSLDIQNNIQAGLYLLNVIKVGPYNYY
jgi:carboxypeptidase T